MKATKAIKKMVALGVGLTMVGATIFGASAAMLSDYPAPFVVGGVPASNLAIIVGDAADGSDVVGVESFRQTPIRHNGHSIRYIVHWVGRLANIPRGAGDPIHHVYGNTAIERSVLNIRLLLGRGTGSAGYNRHNPKAGKDDG